MATMHLVRDWERTLRAENKAPKTIETYGHGARTLIAWLDELPDDAAESDGITRPETVADVTRAHLTAWMADLLAASSASNANTKHRSVQQWFNWLLLEGEITEHPMARMKPPMIPEQPVPLVPDALIRKVLDQCKGRDLLSRRDTAIIRVIWDTGARLSEVANLTLDDVDLDGDAIHVLGKGRRARVIPFSPKTGQAIARYIRSRQTDRWSKHERLWLAEKGKGPLTPNGIKLMLRRRGRVAGINEAIGRNLHAHLGRHGVAHAWQAAGANEGDLMRVMGWKSTQMLKRYGSSAADQRAHATARRLRLGDRL
jgi:site-specific recombinase XerD